MYFLQIQALLADKRVKEALDLAKNARKIGLDKEKFLKVSQSSNRFSLLGNDAIS
jgi:hypothetical protein